MGCITSNMGGNSSKSKPTFNQGTPFPKVKDSNVKEDIDKIRYKSKNINYTKRVDAACNSSYQEALKKACSKNRKQTIDKTKATHRSQQDRDIQDGKITQPIKKVNQSQWWLSESVY